jgi:hypothetical protein
MSLPDLDRSGRLADRQLLLAVSPISPIFRPPAAPRVDDREMQPAERQADQQHDDEPVGRRRSPDRRQLVACRELDRSGAPPAAHTATKVAAVTGHSSRAYWATAMSLLPHRNVVDQGEHLKRDDEAGDQNARKRIRIMRLSIQP